MTTKNDDLDQRIVFFDGHCNLCNGFVDFLIRHDPQHILYFAPLQGSTAARLLPVELRDVKTVVMKKDGIFLQRSSAAIEAVSALGGGFAAVKIFKVIPIPIRDAVYRLIARYRYRWFGKRELCRLPLESEKAFLLP